MDNLDEIIQEAINRLSEVASYIDAESVFTNAHETLSGIFDNFSDYTSLPDDIKDRIISSIVELTGSDHDIIAANFDFAASIDEDAFSGIDADNYASIPSDMSEGSISFCGNNDNADAIKYQQERLDEANHDIEYYEKEIRNFNEKTSDIYRSNCISKLNQATSKAKDATERIQSLRNK